MLMSKTDLVTLGEALPLEIARVSELIGIYETLGMSAGLAVCFMRKGIERAQESIRDQDIVEMLRALKELKDYE